LRIITIDVPFDREVNVLSGAMPWHGRQSAQRLRRAVGGLHHSRSDAILYVADAVPGRIYKLTLDGKVLGTLGESGKQVKQFGWIHEIACPSENELYVAEILNWRMQKLTLHP
jgi:hypothetical protein